MIKMNNKGFAVSTILYGILSLTILILLLIFGIMKSNKDMNSSLVESLTDSMNKCATLESKLENCYLNSSSCQDEANVYRQCLDNEETNTGGNNSLIKLVDKIFDDNIEQADANINFSQISSDTNGKGLYYTSTNTENNLPTYYFRGDVVNNFVQFGQDSRGNKLYWKIIRINEDGSIRLIYNGTSTASIGTATEIDKRTFNSDYLNVRYIGYMYGSSYSSSGPYDTVHANKTNSTVKTYLDDWYSQNLYSYSSYIADSGFCNDRSVYSGDGYSIQASFFGFYNRYNNTKLPQFACPRTNDLFTTKTSTKGNKALTYPIGLITSDEVMYAGGGANDNGNYYLWTGSQYFTMTPYQFTGNASASVALVMTVNGEMTSGAIYFPGGAITTDYVSYSRGIRPVINLNKNVVITNELPSGCTEQKGTAACPYIVDTSK